MGERAAAFLLLSICGHAAFLHLPVHGQNRGVTGPRPFFTSRFVAKTEG